jgi:hypothetical protein
MRPYKSFCWETRGETVITFAFQDTNTGHVTLTVRISSHQQ